MNYKTTNRARPHRGNTLGYGSMFVPPSHARNLNGLHLDKGHYVEISMDTGDAKWHGEFAKHPDLIRQFVNTKSYLCININFIDQKQPDIEGECFYYHPIRAKPLDIQGLFPKIAWEYLGNIKLSDNSGSYCRIGIVEPRHMLHHHDVLTKKGVELSEFETISPDDEFTIRFWKP